MYYKALAIVIYNRKILGRFISSPSISSDSAGTSVSSPAALSTSDNRLPVRDPGSELQDNNNK